MTVPGDRTYLAAERLRLLPFAPALSRSFTPDRVAAL